ncbi:Neurotransmitter-gated ion-channel ligand-binding domain-containing protein [Strongyloides ratti]|uniref:Neurotransmitter-gated ion-channel ligand-binding domain-containing protein n=1 Tax=Strongyloides ratti TaxID=34506 RepID=A0A090KYL9_STRRB|nr:Neurotransmitter-gated ion-channel ligand-binding domain-containing protein [Strongyloides ratti]CEF62610.1 Neurotransmitter-gated ion-channel ligand-binding domain-containing protein [Strongyloides ratti]
MQFFNVILFLNLIFITPISIYGHTFEDIIIERPIRRIDVRELFVEYYNNEAPVIGQPTNIKLQLTIYDFQTRQYENSKEGIIFIKIHQSWSDHRFNFKGRVTSLPDLEERIWKPNICVINAFDDKLISKHVDIFENSMVSYTELKRLSIPVVNGNVTINFEDIPLTENEIQNTLSISKVILKPSVAMKISYEVEGNNTQSMVSLILKIK